MRRLDVWYSLVDATETVEAMDDRASRAATRETIAKAMRKDSRDALESLAEEVGGEYRIRPQPPFVVPVRDLRDAASRDPIRASRTRATRGARRSSCRGRTGRAPSRSTGAP